jgi:hypothetical protein
VKRLLRRPVVVLLAFAVLAAGLGLLPARLLHFHPGHLFYVILFSVPVVFFTGLILLLRFLDGPRPVITAAPEYGEHATVAEYASGQRIVYLHREHAVLRKPVTTRLRREPAGRRPAGLRSEFAARRDAL